MRSPRRLPRPIQRAARWLTACFCVLIGYVGFISGSASLIGALFRNSPNSSSDVISGIAYIFLGAACFQIGLNRAGQPLYSLALLLATCLSWALAGNDSVLALASPPLLAGAIVAAIRYWFDQSEPTFRFPLASERQ